MDKILRDLFVEMCGPVRNSLTPVQNLISYCKEKEVYEDLPETVKYLVDIAESAMKRCQGADKRISEIFQRLGRETLKRYCDYMLHGKE